MFSRPTPVLRHPSTEGWHGRAPARLWSAPVWSLLLGVSVAFGAARDAQPLASVGFEGLVPQPGLLVLESDPTLTPAEPAFDQPPTPQRFNFGAGHATVHSLLGRGDRTGCPDEGFTTRAYGRDSGNDWPWIPANTLVADDLTLEPGNWVISCYDVLIYADNSAAYGCDGYRTVTLRAYNACNGALIPGSQESWNVPPHGGPVLLTGVTNIDFEASGTIWFGLTTTINECDGWYLGQSQVEGSTTNVFQLGTDCAACINPPTCHPWAGFIVVLYGCKLPEVATQPADATICAGGWHQFCVNVQGSGSTDYQWQLDGDDIPGAENACYVATEAGSYRCLATDDCGSVLSESATLTMSTGPTVTANPVGGLACSSHPWQLCAEADAIGELHYQWKRNGLNIIGAVSTCYDAAMPGAYTCVLTDDCGPSETEATTVTVASPELGDFNGDTSADLTDWEVLEDCWTGPGEGIAAGCECVDANADEQIDLFDFAVYQRGFGG